MKKLLFLLSVLILPGMQTCRAADSLPLVVLLGDSIRMNYQGVVKTSLAEKATVWSPKDNCRHTAYTLENLNKWLSGKKPQVVHINIGLHDMFLSKDGKTRHTLQTYSKNLREILSRLKESTNTKIIFATTTPVIEDRQAKSKGYKRVVRRNTDVNRFNAAAKRIATEAGVAVNDLNKVSQKVGTETVLREDGIHLSPKGNQVLGKHVAEMIANALN